IPAVDMGRVGLGINPKNPNTLYALVTAQRGQGGLFPSDDARSTWERLRRTVSDGRGGGRGFGGGEAAQPPTLTPCGALDDPAPATPADAAARRGNRTG